MTNHLLQQVKSCPNLPSLPAIAMHVLEVTRDQEVDVGRLADLVSRDPAMAAKILKTANSSFYGCAQRIGTINQALMILGLNSVKTLVLGFSLVKVLSGNSTRGFNHRLYWKRTIYAATAARACCVKGGLGHQEEAFLAALLADVGMLVLDLTVGDAYGPITAQAASHEDLSAIEATGLGGTHAEVGGAIAEKWRLPALLAGPIAHHHDLDLAGVSDPAARRLSQVVHLAGRIADVFIDPDPAPALADVRRLLEDVCDVTDPAAVDALMADVSRQAGEAAALFDLNVNTEPDYDTILDEAEQAVIELNLRSQQATSELVVQNQQLQRAATTDGLTDLANRACFDAVLAERFAEARASGHVLSLLMLDVDKFKVINDRHGHPTGDAVLRALASVFRAAGRPQDLAARYGGEELCLILPSTRREEAAAVAENIRVAVMGRPIPVAPRARSTGVAPTVPPSAATELTVTVSIGVATYEPGCPLREPAHLLKAADLAVYAAKKAGRNCVRVFTLPATTPATARAA